MKLAMERMAGDGGDAFDMLAHSLKRLSGDYLPGVGVRELGARCLALQDARQQLDGIIAVTVAEADRAGVAANAGTRTMAQYLAARSHVSPDVARADLRVGLWASSYAQIEAALLDGRLSRQHADRIRRLENIRVAWAMLRDQHLFIEWANELEWKSFTRTCAYWLMVNDQDGPEPEDHDAGNTCSARQQPNGRVKVNADLDPASGGIFLQQLGDEANALFNEDHEHGHPRTVGQRNAQALCNLIRRGAGRTETTSKPLFHVVMSLAVLQNAIAQLAKDPEDQDFTSMLDANDIDGRCELIDGTPIHPKYALVLMMQARVRRQVLGAKNVTLEASHETRLFPDWMRYIRLVESRGQCVVAGCDANHTWLHADHRTPRSKQGLTSLANLDPVCGPDNRWKGTGSAMPQRPQD